MEIVIAGHDETGNFKLYQILGFGPRRGVAVDQSAIHLSDGRNILRLIKFTIGFGKRIRIPDRLPPGPATRIL